MATKIDISDIIQNSGVHNDWSPILKRCAEFEWTAVSFGKGKGYRLTSPDRDVTFRVPNGRTGDAKIIERQVTRWLAEQHLKAEGIDADPGDVSEVYPLGGEESGGLSQIRCETHDVTFTSVDAYTRHVAKVHAKMDREPAEPESVAPEPEETPSEAPAEEESTEPAKPAKDRKGNEYQRGPYRKSLKMDGWLARELWKQMRSISQGKDEALSSYCQRLADRIDPNRHAAPGWGVESRPKEVVREVEKEVLSPEAREALENVDRIRSLLGVDPEAKAFLEQQAQSAEAKANEAEAEAKRLRENLAAIVGLAADELKGES